MGTGFAYLDAEKRSEIVELMDGDAEMVIELIDTLLESAPGLMEELAAAVAARHTEGVREAAHALKSSNAQLGAVVFSGMCQQMENHGKNQDADAAAGFLPAMQEEFARVQEALNAWKQSLQA